ncbi:hypothetical protein [Methylomonas methanica]|uniref:Uncharacterized protein n=1 Tax=Methylomonas methanica (strain DSM 25384 / MC09) TaxID=857087 RepID=G0A2Y8_METMM|nr:hypothetical protein [Methylomonas methanica]AEG02647.1 hypothetical protein Metme_4297 [Methylomonas methanica MC09]
MPLNAPETIILVPVKDRHSGGNCRNVFGTEKRHRLVPGVLILLLAAAHSTAAQEGKAHACVTAHTKQFEHCLQEAVERAGIDWFQWQTGPGSAPAGEDTSFAPELNREFMQDADKGLENALPDD